MTVSAERNPEMPHGRPVDAGALLRIVGLAVSAPGGASILRDVALHVEPGEAVVLVGPSGAGKSTLLRALFERDAMRDEGFAVDAAEVRAAGSIGLVPQRGAVFDHLDVAGNVALALRYADAPAGGPAAADSGPDAVRRWLRAVDLDEEWVAHPRAASRLSGGQAQRLAVARVLASGRRVLFLDEPSVGLDPLRVRALAWQLRKVCDENRAGVVVVTHDAQFAAAFADRVLLLQGGSLVPLPLAPRAQQGCRRGAELAAARDALEEALLTALASSPAGGDGGAGEGAATSVRAARAPRPLRVGRPLAVLAQAPAGLFTQLARRPRDVLHVLGYVLRQALLRPLPFYALVSTLLGFTVLYVLGSVGGELGRAASIRVVRGLYVLALTPPLSAFLFVAASSNAVNAWLGGMRLSRQVTALEALGIPRARYLWGPAWGGLVLAYLLVAAVFGAGLLGGGLLLCALQGVPDAWALLTSDVLDPVPERAPYLWRACGLVAIYAAGCAADAVARADDPKEAADDVTRAMTRSVVSCTLWVAALELGSLVLVRMALGRS